MNMKEPEFQDEVRHNKTEFFGTVIAKYMEKGIQYLDVRDTSNRIWYHTPAQNWSIVRAYNDLSED